MSIVQHHPPAPSLITDMLALISRHPRFAILTGVLGLSIPWARDNYRAYLALGECGLPYNVWGWLLSTSLKPYGRETLSVEMYEEGESWLDADLIERRGPRPRTGWHPLPHRQVEKHPAQDIAAAVDQLFVDIASRNPTLVTVCPSPHEREIQAMVIHSDIPSPHKNADSCWREIAHVHPPDHSLHVVLSPADCKLVIERGWGERHPFSGRKLVPLTKEYLFIYAPRNQEELDVVESIIKASIGYMTGRKEVL